MKAFNDLKKNLKKDNTAFKEIKVALLGDSSTQLMVQCLKGYGHEVSINFNVFEGDYNQTNQLVFETTSALYRFNPDFIVIILSTNKIKNEFFRTNLNGRKNYAYDFLKRVSGIYETINDRQKCNVIFFNFLENLDNVFGNFAGKTDCSFLFQIRKLNYELMNLAQKNKNFYICDLSALQNEYGVQMLSDPKFYVSADMIFSLDFLPIISKNIVDIILAQSGIFKKCLILDLDNVLWGGIVGDDGLDNIEIGDLGIGKAFTEIQLWAKQLKERGIILAVCSKNDEGVAKEVFEKHPDMVLCLDDIALFVANWENKAENIRYIQKVLNIGFDSMVFLDDSPFERAMVKENIPGIAVPDLPQDPSEYLEYLNRLNLFETATFTENDSNRTLQYLQENKRRGEEKKYTNENEFLASLGMQSETQSLNNFNIPRVAQLFQRSNQFNLRTIRYTEQDLQKMVRSDNEIPLCFTLSDKFGDYGLICAVILTKKKDALFIDSWVMSCRVLKRGVDSFVLEKIIEEARKHRFTTIQGEFIPTAKNGLVKDHYQNLGFKEKAGYWVLSVTRFVPPVHHILGVTKKQSPKTDSY